MKYPLEVYNDFHFPFFILVILLTVIELNIAKSLKLYLI